MISSEVLEGVPLLVLANKQDVPVLYDLFKFTKTIFRSIQILLNSTDPGEITKDSTEHFFNNLRAPSINNA